MATEQNHHQSRPQVPLRAKKHTRIVEGSLVASSGTISGLPNKHRITIGDRIDINVTGSPPVAIENGVVFGSDMSAYLSGVLGNIAYLRIDQAQSLFDYPGTYPDQATARAAMEAVFTLGTTIYFDSGIFAGASIDVGEMAVLLGQTVHDDTTPGLLSGYWYLILDLASAVGFPALAAFPSETTVSPAVSINNTSGGSIVATGLVVSGASANSVTIATGLPEIASFPDMTVHEHSEIADVLIAGTVESQTMTIGGEPIISSVLKLPYTGSVANLKLIWTGFDELNNMVSSDSPASTEDTQTDVFNVDVDITLIQIVIHPTDPTIGVMVYLDLGDSKIYLKCFKFAHETGFDNAYTPHEVVGADSADVRIGFVTVEHPYTHSVTSSTLVVVGGKNSPGTAIYAGSYTINTTSLAISDDIAWADTGHVTTAGSDLVNIDRVIDGKNISSSVRRFAIYYNSSYILLMDDLFTSLVWDAYSSFVNPYTDIYVGQGNILLLLNKDQKCSISSSGDGTIYPITANTGSRYKKIFTGSDIGKLTLYKVERYSGIGGETISVEGALSFDPGPLQRERSYFDAVPSPFQNSNSRNENMVFDLEDNKILFFKSLGWYVISDRVTGEMLFLGKIGSNNITKIDHERTVMINKNTVLFYNTGWKSVKFYSRGPYLVYKKEGAYAIAAPPGTKVALPFSLDAGKTYYWSMNNGVIGMTPKVDTNPEFMSRKLGTAITPTVFISELEWRGSPRLEYSQIPYATSGEAEAAASTTVVMNPLRTRELLNAAVDIPRWKKFTVAYTDLSSFSPLAANQGFYNLAITVSEKLVIHQVVQKHNTAFAGTGITAVAASVGYGLGPLDMQYYSDPLDVYQAVADTAFNNTVSNAVTDMVGTTHGPRVFVETTGGAIADLTAGSVDVWVKYSVLP